MSLLTVHKSFIIGAIAVILIYGWWEVGNYLSNADLGAVPRALAALACAIGLAMYLRRLGRGTVAAKRG
ncbi:MAG TPA: hypothetical protein VMW17_11090 [Candidatus Binatia bacterium]|nr:hypothetical protein [Candidatus Binatia bacterium]